MAQAPPQPGVNPTPQPFARRAQEGTRGCRALGVLPRGAGGAASQKGAELKATRGRGGGGARCLAQGAGCGDVDGRRGRTVAVAAAAAAAALRRVRGPGWKSDGTWSFPPVAGAEALLPFAPLLPHGPGWAGQRAPGEGGAVDNGLRYFFKTGQLRTCSFCLVLSRLIAIEKPHGVAYCTFS